ncbi:HIT domain-containing protein [Wukongibacter baidiensis]|uniref:HIT domain-containing protein n=1 Tax=Wukongibacter baidiensis TaxID=1723361 RepID=UPI003D7F7962
MKKFMFWIARRNFMGKIIGLIISKVPLLVPAKYVNCNEKVAGFYHPVPSYKKHILFIPRKIISTLLDVKKDSDVLIIKNLLDIASLTAKELGMEKEGFVICANGGKRQDVMQLHFHLYVGKVINISNRKCSGYAEVINDEQIIVRYYEDEDSRLNIHIKLKSIIPENDEISEVLLYRVIELMPEMNKKFDLVDRGYSIILQYEEEAENDYYRELFITTGKAIKKSV